jgi:hypothetical protein
VHGDPARDGHTDGGNFGFLSPDTRKALAPTSLCSKPAHKADYDFLQRPDVLPDSEIRRPNVNNRVNDDLAGPVVGDFATSLDVKYGNAPLLQDGVGHENVLFACVAAKRYDRLVLGNERNIFYFSTDA